MNPLWTAGASVSVSTGRQRRLVKPSDQARGENSLQQVHAQLSLPLVMEVVGLLPPRSRRHLVLYVAASFVAAVLDVVGVAAVLPLVQVLAGGSLSEGYLGALHALLGTPDRTWFTVILGTIIIGAFLLKTILVLLIRWFGGKFTMSLEVALQEKLLAAYMNEPYARHRTRNTAEIVRTTGAAASATFNKILGGVLTLLAEGLSVLVLLTFLLALMPIPTLAAIGYFSLSMFVIDRVLAPINHRTSSEFMLHAFHASQALLESTQGFREVRMHNAEAEFVNRFAIANRLTADAGRKAGFASTVPKYVLELMAVIGIALVVGILSISSPGPQTIGALALFAAAAVKMLPAAVRLTATVGTMRSGVEGARITLNALEDFVNLEGDGSARRQTQAPSPSDRVPETIELDDVTFKFSDAADATIEHVSLTIPPGSSLALCGSSGSGKTTLVDLILGLQTPTIGTVSYGGLQVADLGAAWRAQVGYIPQDVYLLDDSLSANVAFGLPAAERNIARIHECLTMCQLDDLLATMPEGVETRVGERGTRLSGGQRQRLGIARALYHDPAVLVMDEATSALDNETEDQIVQTIEKLSGDRTVIMVAHRLSTVRDVDMLVFMEGGRISTQGTFLEVRDQNPRFAQLVRLGDLSNTTLFPTE